MKEVFQINNVELQTPLFHKWKMEERVNTRQLFIGFFILVLGVLFYYFFRSAEYTYFLKFLGNKNNLKDFLPPLFVTLGNSLPTFIHVFAFSLMTAGLVDSQKKSYLIVCLSWFVIDVFFELGQCFANNIIPIIPGWFSDIIFLENTKDFFLHGKFDFIDLLSIALGSIAAYTLLIKTSDYKGETS
jgi:hypothetical protein